MQQTASDAYEQSEENKDDIMQLKSDLAGVTDTVKVLQSNCSSLKDYIVAQDTYSRRDNLLFDNVPDSKNANPEAREDCAQVVHDILVKNLKSTKDVDQIRFVRCHRKGKPKKSGIRTLICHLDYFGDNKLPYYLQI